MTVYEPETAWACACSDGNPVPFIMAHTVRFTRAESQDYIGSVWRRQGETNRQGWRRAYRNGCRCIRVSVAPA